MKKITNQTESEELKEQESTAIKKIKKMANDLTAEAEKSEIPILVVYFDPQKGYQYKAVLPEQFNTPEMRKEYGKFNKFLQVCIDLNEGMPIAQITGETGSF